MSRLKSRRKKSKHRTRKSLIPGTPMARDFMAYWRPSTVDRVIEKNGGEALAHAASDQFGRVAKGNTFGWSQSATGSYGSLLGLSLSMSPGRLGLLDCLDVGRPILRGKRSTTSSPRPIPNCRSWIRTSRA
jgi:hypothetical protein